MIDFQQVTIILIIAGGIIISISAIYIKQILKLLKRNKHRALSAILFGMILFFSISYFASAAIIAFGHATAIYAITGLIFFMAGPERTQLKTF